MGYRCRWLAIRGRDRTDVLARLKFGVEAELSEVHDPGLYAVEIDGWLVVIGAGWDFMDLVTRLAAARLSSRCGAEVLYLYTDDTPMTAEITSFLEGQVQWSILYDGTAGPGRATTEGALPPEAKPIIAARQEAQKAAGPKANVDHVYDTVAALGLALIGFRHDRTLDEGKYLPVYQLKPS